MVTCQPAAYDGRMTQATPVQARWLNPREQAAWRAYLEMSAKLSAHLNRQMLGDFGLSVADFAVLVQLSEHVDSRMRILELARALGWEKSRLSHQLTRMQQRGLIERSNCSEDRRGAFVILTDQGRKTVEAAAPGHVEVVRTYLFDCLTEQQVEALDAIARSVLERLDRACAGAVQADDALDTCP
jgi:DNA-binding MarR family transcriptional regulator